MPKRPTIGVLPGWQVYEGYIHGFLDLVLRSIHSAAQERDCNLLVACGMGNAIGRLYPPHPAWPVGSAENDFVPVGPWNTDGLIVINPLMGNDRSRYIQQIRKEGHPVVFIGPSEEGLAVVPDNESGIHQAVVHLAQHGHRRIAFIAGHQGGEDVDSVKRLQAYRNAIKELGLEDDPDLVVYGSHDFEGGGYAMRQLLESGRPFRAVLASNDQSAFGAIAEIKKANLQIPQDVAIVGFDDWPEAVSQEPPLTTVHYPIADASQKALELLLEVINGRSRGDEVIQIPVNLIVRESCGCQSGNPALLPAALWAGVKSTDAKEVFIWSMAEAVHRQARSLAFPVAETLCRKLVEAYIRSMQETDLATFRAAFLEILNQSEKLDENQTIWHPALSLLERDGICLTGVDAGQSGQCAEELLSQARVEIGVNVQKQYAQYISHRSYIADQIGLLTSRLFTAVDEAQILGMLGAFLPKVGIGRADIAFYEAAGEDPAAWSRLYAASDPSHPPFRFPSRQFPPEELFPSDKPFNLALFPLLDRDQVEGFVAFDNLDLATCVTLVRQLTAAFRGVRLYREAIQGRKLAEEADRTKSRFLASVSHELRTPLNLIAGLSEMLLDGDGESNDPPLPEVYRRDIAQIHSSAQHLGWLIRDVLDLASSQAGQLRLTNGPVDAAQMLAVVAAAGEQLACKKGLAWEADIPSGLPGLWGDQTRLTQVGLNLVSNAVKFTEEGRVELKARVEGESLLVEVSDTGLGIPLEEQQLIFNEFRQSERTSRRGYGGLGLGLAICKRLVELHGGEIGVRSSGEEPSGSTFYFRLPILEGAPPGAAAPRTAALVVEALEQGEQLRAHLERQGYTVEVCRADEGGRWLSGLLAKTPQAVVLEAGVAGKQGWEALKTFKSNPSTRGTPVLFYTLQGGSGSLLALDYLSKPLNPQALTAVLESQGLEVAGQTSKTVLIVDDEPGILEMHARLVAGLGAGYQVLKARNGREALETIRQVRPDLVLLDLMMPELDGFGVLEAMREGETTRDIPVVVLTAQVLTETDIARLNQGVAAVLQKGLFSVQETLAHIETIMARQPRLNSEMQKIIRKAMAYLHEHYAETYSRRVLAQHLGVSEQYLTRCFRQELGLTPIEYLNRYRVKQARLKLAAGKSITDVALEVGFSSVSHFTKLFQKEAGKSPGAFRRNHLKE